MFLLSITKSSPHGPEALPLLGSFEGPHFKVVVRSSLQNVTYSSAESGFSVRWGRDSDQGNGPRNVIRLSGANDLLRIDGSNMFGLPLYYTVDKRGDFFCATHIKLLREVGVDIEENQDALPEFFVYRCVMPPFTLYKGIRRILHAGSVEHIYDGRGWSLSRESPPEWIQNEGGGSAGSFDDHLDELTSRVRSAVKGIPGTHHNMASLMSGGIDSSITSLLCRQERHANDTFSTSYPFESSLLEMERPYAESAAQAMEFHHKHYVPTEAGYRAGVLESIALAEEPVHHLQTPCFNVMFEDGIPRERTALVHGLGAGGAFGNFRNHLYMLDKPLYRALQSSAAYPLVKGVSRLTGRGRYLLGSLDNLRDRHPLEDYRNPLWQWHQYGDVDWVCDYFKTTPAAIIADQQQNMQRLNTPSLYHTWASYSLLGDEDITLTLWAKIAHAHGRVLHSPFYDSDVLRYAFSMPWQQKLQKPENCVRKSMAKRVGVPDFITTRRKSGFGVKRNDWAVEGSVFDPLVELSEGVLDSDLIRRMRTRVPSEAMTFWSMLNYALWKRLCIDGDSIESLQRELAEAEERVSANA